MSAIKEMVTEFQCPGCVCGIRPDECSSFRLDPLGNGKASRCAGHVPGTRIVGVGRFLLGMPKGFNREGSASDGKPGSLWVRLWPEPPPADFWDRFNVAVWAMEQDGYLFVRTYAPRINEPSVDVIKGGTLSLVPGAIDVGAFLDEID